MTPPAGELWARLDRASARRGVHVPGSGGTWEHVPWTVVRERAEHVAGGLRARGVGPGDPVASVLTNDLATVGGILGTWLAGAHLLSLPAPARAMAAEHYVADLGEICRRAGARMLAAAPEVAAGLGPALEQAGVPVVAWDALDGPARPDAAEPPPPGAPAFVQFSSGSTSRPKGCVLTADAIAAQMDVIHGLSQSQPGGDDVVSTWLPLSHDMGMFGCLLFAWTAGYDLVLSSPQRFMRAPRSWLEDCARFGATLTATPCAGLHVATRAAASRLPGELRLRTVVLGGERVDWSTVARAIDVLAPAGLEAHHLRPAYGLAEATLAVTATAPDRAPSALHLDAPALAEGVLVECDAADPAATTLVSCGAPCPGVQLRVEDDAAVGRLHLSSPSLAAGYLLEREHDHRWGDGWFATDDVALLHDGELHVAGRLDDILVVGGRNVPALDLEEAIARLPGVRRGCCTLIDVPAEGGSRIALVVEVRDGAPEPDELLRQASVLAAAWDVPIHALLVAETGATPKTPSGKVQRHRCRAAITGGQLALAASAGHGLGVGVA